MKTLRLVASTLLASLTHLSGPATASAQLIQPQLNTFKSDFNLTASQIASLNLSASAANNINVAARFERSNWATGSVYADPFYASLPSNASDAPAGSVLKVEAYVDTGDYTIAPTLALSRIVYQSETLNGTKVPVSAFLLWPYLPRSGEQQAPLVSWGHGTSGIFAECAPSHIRNLWYQFTAPYELALAGYAVVATDYAGLGVPNFPNGEPIVHQYVAQPAAGNDMLYAAQAAHAAFPDKVTKEFVVMGHSQGGGAAWAAAQQQLGARVPGYLGSIAGSPVTDAIETARLAGTSLGLIQSAKGIHSIFPDVPLSDMLTETGLKVLDLMEQVQGCNSVFSTLLLELIYADMSIALTRDEFVNSYYAHSFENLTIAGGRDFAGPMLVLQGTADDTIPESQTSSFVKKTCSRFPDRELHYVKAKGIGHVPTMYATQQIWLDWLDERFGFYQQGRKRIADKKGCEGGKGKCTTQVIGSSVPMPIDQYQSDLNYYLEYALNDYEVA